MPTRRSLHATRDSTSTSRRPAGMVVVPLVFTALTLGIAEIGDLRKLGRMGLQFEKVDSADQAAIDEFVEAHFFSNRRA